MTMAKYVVASTTDIEERSGRAVTVKGVEIAVFHLSDGQYYAVENRCPHKNGPLAEGIISGNYVFCPLHDWKIDTTNGQVQAPDTGCVQTYKVEVEQGKIFIHLDEESVSQAG
jgi:nitrite reductase (NADH) small subunit